MPISQVVGSWSMENLTDGLLRIYFLQMKTEDTLVADVHTAIFKVLSQELRSLGFIIDIQKWKNGVHTIMAMSRKPISIGPVDIKGPLMCPRGAHLEKLSNPHSFPPTKLDDTDTKSNTFV